MIFEEVSFSYDGLPVLEKVTARVEAGAFVCVVGPNGGGKTTMLKLMLGLLQPDEGQVRVFGQRPRNVRERIGYTPQHTLFDPRFPVTVMDVALMGLLEHHWGGRYSEGDRESAMRALDEMGLKDVVGRPFNALSGGQRQRVLIARSLVSNPDLLLLDEPTANMDPVVGNRLIEILERLNERMTIVMVSHDLGFVSSVVSSVLCVNHVAHIHPTSEVSGEMIQEVYGGDYRMIRHDHRCAEEGHTHV